MEEFITKIIDPKILTSVIVLILCFIIYKIVKKIIKNSINKKHFSKKQETYVRLTTNLFKYLFLVIVILFILQINGVNVSSLIAGLGIVSAIVGLALQDFIKDIIMGINIITEEFFMVGDIIKFNGIEGKVVSIGLKNTKIKDIYTGDIVCITNRNIDKIVNISKYIFLNIPIHYEDSVENIEKILQIAIEEIKTFENVNDCEYLGIDDFADSSIIYKIKIECNPEFKPSIRRKALRCIKLVFDEHNVEIPYKQIDVHNK